MAVFFVFFFELCSSERAGGVFADTLGEIAKFDAERREEIREFQDDVMVGVAVVQAELI